MVRNMHIYSAIYNINRFKDINYKLIHKSMLSRARNSTRYSTVKNTDKIKELGSKFVIPFISVNIYIK